MNQRSNSKDTRTIYVGVLESLTPCFTRPEDRIRFLKFALGQFEREEQRLRRSLRHIPLFRETILFWLLKLSLFKHIHENPELWSSCSPLRPPTSEGSQVNWLNRLCLWLAQTPGVFHAVTGVLVVAVLGGLYSLGASVNRFGQSLQGLSEQTRPAFDEMPRIREIRTGRNETSLQHSPGNVWLVAETGNVERYSNGLRIIRNHETKGPDRNFFILQHDLEKPAGEIRHSPLGIMYHSSESDLIPFEAANSASLEEITHDLIGYARRRNSYHYVIDRFGQVYRIVPDLQVANHAGRSVWGDENGIMIELNYSFIGICFETKSGANSDEGEKLTEGQIVAGRQLTSMLRSKYGISDANCVTHGLASVNPDNMLIAYHYDWLNDFPFAELGVSNKYSVPIPSIADGGFTYDKNTLNRMRGELHPGIAAAEKMFNMESEGTGQLPEERRKALRLRYLKQMRALRALQNPASGKGINGQTISQQQSEGY